MEKSRERKPLFTRKPNANFMKQEAVADDIQVLEPKRGKPPMQPDTGKYTGEGVQHISTTNSNGEPGQSTNRKSKAQRKFEREMRQSARNVTAEEPGMSDDMDDNQLKD